MILERTKNWFVTESISTNRSSVKRSSWKQEQEICWSNKMQIFFLIFRLFFNQHLKSVPYLYDNSHLLVSTTDLGAECRQTIKIPAKKPNQNETTQVRKLFIKQQLTHLGNCTQKNYSICQFSSSIWYSESSNIGTIRKVHLKVYFPHYFRQIQMEKNPDVIIRGKSIFDPSQVINLRDSDLSIIGGFSHAFKYVLYSYIF